MCFVLLHQVGFFTSDQGEKFQREKQEIITDRLFRVFRINNGNLIIISVLFHPKNIQKHY